MGDAALLGFGKTERADIVYLFEQVETKMKLINAMFLAVAILGLAGTTAHPGPPTQPGVATRSKAQLAENNARLLAKFQGVSTGFPCRPLVPVLTPARVLSSLDRFAGHPRRLQRV